VDSENMGAHNAEKGALYSLENRNKHDSEMVDAVLEKSSVDDAGGNMLVLEARILRNSECSC
jgi:hypothetical protein